MTYELDPDRAVENKDKDEFGFAGIAERLAPRIVEASNGDGMVIGLEGKWGTGKTSLLNFLREELSKSEKQNVHTITVSPWLNGDTESLVTSVLEPISRVLENTEFANSSVVERAGGQIVENANGLRELVTNYGSKTARRLVPVAELAGLIVPGAQMAGEALGTVANVLENAAESPMSPTEMKSKIVERIRELDVGFVVLLDDLDRLEPAQAVEVVRLVRSVADFPKVAYVMCYDRDVLSDALSEGLRVKNGDLFLQKIVQLTFSIPLPEPFDLRTQFLKAAINLYEDLHKRKLSAVDHAELRDAVDREGERLATPREVKLALNGIRFIYPSVCEDVYFPDFCRLHLIKTTHHRLYRWLEDYLSVRSVIVSGDGMVGAEQAKRYGKALKKLFPFKKPDSPRSLWHASTFIPGIDASSSAKEIAFAQTSEFEYKDFIARRRLGSPLHYRYYFALTGPKTVISEKDFNDLILKATSDPEGFNSQLSKSAREFRQSGKTWFEHILDRLDESFIEDLEWTHLAGIVVGLCETMDTALGADRAPRFGFNSVERLACRVVGDCMRRLKSLSSTEHRALAQWIAKDCKSINWIVGHLLRDELFSHGRIGDGSHEKEPDRWVFSDEILDDLLEIAKERITHVRQNDLILEMPDISNFMYGWANIAGDQPPKDWVTVATEPDERFIKLLNALRGYAVSNRVYYPLNHYALETFFEDPEAVSQRLVSLQKGNHKAEADDLLEAIEQGKRW